MDEKEKEIEIEGIKYNVELIDDLNDEKKVKTYKVIIIGKTGVGKTSISLKLKSQILNKKIETEPTISVDIISFKVKVNETIIRIQLWDACGNEEFAKTTSNLFQNIELSIIVYAIDMRESFEDVKSWNNILNSYNPNCLKYLIGNKIDLEKKREVQIEEGEKFKKEYEFNLFLETSAENGSNIKNLLKNIGVSIYNKENLQEENLESKNTITLDKDEVKSCKKKKKKCC